MDIKKKITNFPDSPGIYLMKGKASLPAWMKDRQAGRILYVGKASSLCKRVSSYFHGIGRYTLTGTSKCDTTRKLPAGKTQALLSCTADIDYIQTVSSAQALLLENSLIKRYRPYYNVVLKDDKSYPYIKIKDGDDYPYLVVTRGKKEKNARYYGPYTNVKLLKAAIKTIRAIFPFRSCLRLPRKPCLYLQLKLCPGMCVQKVSRNAYRETLKQLGLFLEGKYNELLRQLKEKMRQAARNQLYEQAALLRDRISSLSEIVAQTKETKQEDLILALQKTLRLAKAPYRIEAFDVSQIAGDTLCGSMVSFFAGRPDKKNYRKFKIKTVGGIDDYAMICEVLRRRYSNRGRRELGLPDLVMIDGGKGHLSSAQAALEDLGLKGIPLIALAKRLENIYTPSGRLLSLPRDSKVLHLLQRIRDEAHRFSISYHRKLREKGMRASSLDKIPGVGPKRKKALLNHFKSVQAIRQASLEDLLKVVDKTTAQNIKTVSQPNRRTVPQVKLSTVFPWPARKESQGRQRNREGVPLAQPRI